MTADPLRVAVFGMGYVGCVTAAVLAREGHAVAGVETNPSKAAMLEAGESPVLEPGLPELVKRVRASGRLTVARQPAEPMRDADVAVICVGTPSAASGALDTRYVQRVAEDIGAGLAENGGYPVVVMRSTALPGVVEGLVLPALERTSGKRAGRDFGLAVNPEFLREGNSLEDFDHPEFTLVGADEPRTVGVLERLYRFLAPTPFVVTDRRSAALVKYASNAFHAMKVAFANEIGMLCASAGLDGREVMRVFCLDRKLNISTSYLRPGMPFGGSCLPKDVRALLHHGRQQDVPLPLLHAVMESNRLQTDACVAQILSHDRRRIGVLGMAFKAGTDDLRESPTVEIIERLIGKGADVAIFDDRVSLARLVGANREYLNQRLPHVARLLKPTLDEVLAHAEVVVVGNGDPAFVDVRRRLRPGQVLVDLVGHAARGA